MEEIEIKTRTGRIIGKTDAFRVSIFRGIPWAQQPVGERRRLPPEPLNDSRQDIDAFDFGKTVVQAVDPVEEASLFPQGEDRLTLNIWVKNPRTSERQVMDEFQYDYGFKYSIMFTPEDDGTEGAENLGCLCVCRQS